MNKLPQKIVTQVHPVLTKLDAERLPSLPSVAMETVRLCKDENASLHQLSDIVSVDPTLAAKILKVANSAKYRRRQELTDLNRACFVLGMNTLKVLALGFSITQDKTQESGENEFPFKAYWTHSVSTAVAARDLSHLIDSSHEDEAFLCGLIGRIGQMVVGKSLGDEYAALFPDRPDTLPTGEEERLVLGFDFHQITKKILRKWELPELLVSGSSFWGVPASESPDLLVCKIVRIADHIARLIHEPVKGPILNEIYQMAEKDFGLSSDEMDGFMVVLNDEIASLAEILNVKFDDPVQLQELVDEAHSEIVSLSLETSLQLDDVNNDLERERKKNSRLAVKSEELQRKGQLDALTGVPNRGAFDEELRKVIRMRINGDCSPYLSLMMLDVDHFKSFNDTYGHLVGDKVLRKVAEAVRGSLRPSDFLARYGGEEFVVIVPEASEEDLMLVAERSRLIIESLRVENEGEPLQVTASIGAVVGSGFQDVSDGIELIKQTDALLYKAKSEGRNRCALGEVDFSK